MLTGVSGVAFMIDVGAVSTVNRSGSIVYIKEKIMRDGKILIVGGYGAVGRNISATLGNSFPGRVIVAGRNYQKAKEFSSQIETKLIPLELDITSISKNDKRLSGVNLVIMCIDQKGTQFVRHCIQQGIHYVDISATYVLLSEIESLHNEAKKYHSTVVLSVGLAPGVTNLLAKHCKSKIPNMRYADIYILLGLGDVHGEAAIRWSLEELNAQFSIKEAETTKQVRSFSDGKKTMFFDGIGERTAYRFNFSDQHVITKTLELDSASTRMCLDSRFVTYLYFLLKKWGVSKLFKFRIVQNFMIWFLQKFHFGSDKFIVKVEARKLLYQSPVYECSISGNEEARITGLVTAKVAENLYTSSFNPGVFHIEQLFNIAEIIKKISNDDLRFEERDLRR